MTTPALDFDAPPVRRLRADLALALRAAAHHRSRQRPPAHLVHAAG